VPLGCRNPKERLFVNLFSDGGRFSENQENKSRIELHELAAKAFPDLLDYLYCAESSPNINTENATALQSLAKYFDMPQLRWAVKEFWTADIKLSQNCGTYYEHAHLLQANKIFRAAAQSCMDNIWKITPPSRLVHVDDAGFWIKLLNDKSVTNRTNFSYHMSKLIAAFCLHVPIDMATFEKLTAPKLLPTIDGRAALLLLDAERRLVAPDAAKLTRFQERCMKAFANDWELIDLLEDAKTMEILRRQSPLVLAELLARTMDSAIGRSRFH
jgi:hypothetical protein